MPPLSTRWYVLSRLGQSIFVLWAAFTVAFFLLQALPGDAIRIKFEAGDMGLSPEQIADIRIAYGADVPIWQQYIHTLINFVQGDFGTSILRGVPVSVSILTNLSPTLWLTGLGFLAAVVLAGLITILSTLTPFQFLRNAIRSLPSLFISIPVFWLGIVLIQVFSFQLKLIPVIGAGEWEALILPVATLAVPIAAPIAQVLIRAIDDIETQPFVFVARAKGASRAWVLWRHVLRNAAPQTLTIAGVLFGELLAGAVITETVFGRNGLGRLTEQAVNSQDAAVLQAVVVLAALGFVLVNLLVDLIHPLIDPRLNKPVGVRA